MADSSTCSLKLSMEVGHLVGAHRARYLDKLRIASVDMDPYLLPLANFTDLITSPTLPEFTPHDLYHYVVNNASPYTGADLKAYKSLDAYQFFIAGWVNGTRCFCQHRGKQFLIMAKVHHSQALSEPPLKPWVSLQKDGTVLCGHCTCKAGLGEVCSHITALLYALESAVKYLQEKSCTDGPRQWGLLPVKAGKALYEEGLGIDFTNPAKKHSGVKKKPEAQLRKKAGVSEAAVEKFYKALDSASQTPSEKSGILCVLPEYCKQFQPKVLALSLPEPLTELYNPHHRKLSASDLGLKCDDVFINIEVTPEQAVKVEEETRQQGQSRLWFDMRAGRVTASVFKSAARTDPTNPSKSVIRQICYPDQCGFSTAATRWGCQNEKTARQTYEAFASTQHQDLKVCDSGLHINPSWPYLGASPDALLSCTCCGNGVLEIKCPLSAKDTGVLSATNNADFYIRNTNGSYYLRRDHAYFYQVQSQMFVTERKYCDFIVWSESDYFVERIVPDADLMREAVQHVELFFRSAILPELLAKKYTCPQLLSDTVNNSNSLEETEE